MRRVYQILSFILAISGSFLSACSDESQSSFKNENFPTDESLVVYTPKEVLIDPAYSQEEYLELQQNKYQKRKEDFFNLHRNEDFRNIHAALVRLHLGIEPSDEGFINSIQKISRREDCSDFRMIGFIRFVYQFLGTPLVRQSLQDSVHQSILDFKFWPDEPGIDNMCTWSENHHILFSTCEYLAGNFYPNEIFSNSGHSGKEKYERGKERVMRWLDLRYKTGFSEWLSNVYYTEDIAPLVALVDFSPDKEIQQKASMVLDLMLFDMALNHYNGTFGSTHGRSYFSSKISGRRESSSSTYHLIFGLNHLGKGNMATNALAISKNYKVPFVLYEIANDTSYERMTNLQRMGLNMDEIENYGLDVNLLEDGMTFLSLEAYCHPRTVDLTMQMFDEYNWWENSFFKPFASQKGLLTFLRKTNTLPLAVQLFNKDLNRNTRTEANIYTFRTPDYMLSSAQDYKKGYGGDQQSIWSAVLDEETIVFTTHPVGNNSATPDYWTGSGNLPRVGQSENVAIVLYKISTAPGLYVTHDLEYTHAWFPKDKFDTTAQIGNWVFGKRKNGYIGLWSQNAPKWVESGEYANKEIIADGKKNIWICEMGSRTDYHSFEDFIETVSASDISAESLSIKYQSPSQGKLEFAWDGDMKKEEQAIQLNNYPRYMNNYVKTSFPAGTISINYKGYSLEMNYEKLERLASEYLN
jgi:hypothetical protein